MTKATGHVTEGLLRDRLLMRLAAMGGAPDYVRLAEEVLSIRNAPEPLARRLVAQALVVEDRRPAWASVGETACERAPLGPAVYFFRDAAGAVLYVGKALNLRRRLRAHFARQRWRTLKPLMARVASIEWQEVGSELEALLVESHWIEQLAPAVNVQRKRNDPPRGRARNVVVLLPSLEAAEVTVIAARRDGAVLNQTTRRDGSELVTVANALVDFFAAAARTSKGPDGPARTQASIVFAWLRQRGAGATQFDADDGINGSEWCRKLSRALSSKELFHERLMFQ